MKNNYLQDKITKYFYLILINLFFFISISHSLENKIITKINNQIITTQDIQNEYKYLLALNKDFKIIEKQKAFEISKRSIIREKIKEIEILNNFKELDVDEKFLNQILKNIYHKIGIKNLESFKIYLTDKNVDFELVKRKIMIEASWNNLIYLKFFSQVKIDKDKIRENVINNRKKFTQSFQLSEILFKVFELSDLNIQYNKIKEMIENEGFGNAAITYSISSTANMSGNLGWINEESLQSSIKNKILELKVNEYTKPISVPGGFLILKLNSIKEVKKETQITVDQEVNKIINSKKNEQLNQFSSLYFNKIKKNLDINEI
jgi:peptidyl-prolyl cis-trans isomerase SurA